MMRTIAPRRPFKAASVHRSAADCQLPRDRPPAHRMLWRVAGTAACAWTIYALAMLITTRAACAEFWPMNGDYQGYDWLRRLMAGELVGRDFDTYLGIGPLYVNYVVLNLLGTRYCDSLMATHLASMTLYCGSLILLCRIAGWRYRTAWLLIALTATLAAAKSHWLPDEVHLRLSWSIYQLLFPSNSWLSLRAAAPIIVAAGLLLTDWVGQCWPRLRGWGCDIVAHSMLGGLAVIWSNDYGLTTWASLVFALSIPTPNQSWRRRMVHALLVALGSLAAGWLLVSVLTGGFAGEWFEYNYRHVAGAQFYYFLGTKIVAWSDIPKVMYVYVALGVATVAGYATRVVRGSHCGPTDVATRRAVCRASTYGRAALLLLIAPFLAGMLSATGTADTRYFVPLDRSLCVLLTGLVLSSRRVRLLAARFARARGLDRCNGAKISIVAACLVTVALVDVAWSFHRRYRPGRVIAAPHSKLIKLKGASLHDVEELGGLMDRNFDRTVALGRQMARDCSALGIPPQQRVFSTYASVLSDLAGARHAARNDYIIHALGEERAAEYVERFRATRPRYVVTIAEAYTPFENWVRQANWDFYTALIEEYEPWERTFYAQIWKRRAQPYRAPPYEIHCHVEQTAPHQVKLNFEVPAEQPGVAQTPWLATVEISYRTEWVGTPVLNGALRQYLMASDPRPSLAYLPDTLHFLRSGLHGLPTGEHTRRFPVELTPGATQTVTLTLSPPGSSRLLIERCTARPVIQKQAIDHAPARQLFTAWHSDGQQWQHGIGLASDAAVFLLSTDQPIAVAPGMQIEFAKSGVRRVMRVIGRQVWVSGGRLDPAGDGFPNPVQVVSADTSAAPPLPDAETLLAFPESAQVRPEKDELAILNAAERSSFGLNRAFRFQSSGVRRVVEVDEETVKFDGPIDAAADGYPHLIVPVDGGKIVVPSDFTDPNWTHGIWVHSPLAGFFTFDSLARLRVGEHLKFHKSGIRKIIEITPPNVFVEGPPLDPIGDGFPHCVQLISPD